MVNKHGSEKYYIIISLILGLIVLGLSLSFIFKEYFNEDELDWQQCRQSIILRSSLPNLKELGTDLKGAFPLKCKTVVVTIDSGEGEEVYGKISETIAQGWYMFGEGELDFVHRDLLRNKRYCLVYARIHSTGEDAQKSDRISGEDPIDLDVGEFSRGFYNYYIGTKIPGREETYNDYLPMLGSNKPSSRFIFNPKIDLQREDIALVYVINKYSPLTKLISYIPFILVGSKILTGESLNNLIEKIENVNFIHMVPISDLDKIGCTEYLTIPA